METLPAPAVVHSARKEGSNSDPEKAPLLSGQTPVVWAGGQVITPRTRKCRVRKLAALAGHFVVCLGLLCMLQTYGIVNLMSFRRAAPSQHTDPSIGECVQHANWDLDDDHHWHDNFHYHATTAFSLPRDSSLLYFVSRGNFANGGIELSHDGTEPNHVTVEVEAWYNSEEWFNKVDVCSLKREQNENGLAIFTPDHRHRHDHHHRLSFKVKVRLPASDQYQRYERLETNLPLFAHDVEGFADSAEFKFISLKSANMPIHVQSLSAGAASITTTNAAIVGEFNSSGTLILQTSNAAIVANVTLSNDNEGQESSLSLLTTNSPIKSNVSLISTADDATGGEYVVTAITANGPLDLSFPLSPVDSKLNLNGRTSNSPVRAQLHAAYEGAFSLHGSPWMHPTVEVRRDVEDPAGRGRSRGVLMRTVARGIVEGKVEWKSQFDQELGKVLLSTSNAGIHLKV
ncbi:hypothetical protein K474DRAFT_1702696 [Panus rudis PR-1116 ss-1]|nr:hypothetical protein K474DRAFT_1702696 [Panus rudis PR-1116 ss-1]